MPLKLRADMCLDPRTPEGYVALLRRDVGAGPVFRLHPLQALALSLFDGRRSPGEVAAVFSSALDRSHEEAMRFIAAVERRYGQFLEELQTPGSDCSASSENGQEAESPAPEILLFPTQVDFRAKREAAPSALMWVVTEFCDKRCQYCYMNAKFTRGLPDDLLLSYDRLCELIDEAAEIGVNRWVLSGGEPFLRPDLIALIGRMVERRIVVIPITKSRITGDRMARLAATGLRELHISLDSHRPEIVDQLTGVDGAFTQMLSTIDAAVAHGIAVVLRPVLTNLNVGDIEGLVELAAERGVSRVMMDVYGQTCGRHQESLLLTRASKDWLDDHWPQLEARYREGPVQVYFDLPAGGASTQSGCVEGLKGLTFLPDGRVTKCDHWRFDDQLIYGDLRRQSLFECWTSAALQEINFPDREDYLGTICYHCKNLPHCDTVRGRCSMSALAEYGSHAAPDVYCPIGAFERHLPTERSCHQNRRGAPQPGLVKIGGGNRRRQQEAAS